MTNTTAERGAPGVRDRRPRRVSYPDLSFAASGRARAPAPLPLFVYVAGVPHNLRDLGREPGDEADRVLELTGPGGQVHLVGESRWGHECNCAEFTRRDCQDCGHIRALRVARVLAPIALDPDARFAVTDPGLDLDAPAGAGGAP